MLLHEWLQYRDRRIRRLREQADQAEQELERETAQEQGPEPEPEVYAPPAETNAEERPDEEAQELTEETAAAEETPPVAEEAPAESEAPAERKAKRRPARPKSAREVLETLQPSQDLRARLEAVLARQRRLPLDEVTDEGRRPKRGKVVETREQLVERLLDPTLTLQEAALLLGVCPTTVRRYTNRGILKCFRTPGNQRRFKLSDILEFMERREREQQGEE